jgi:hypothetical protein
MTNVLGVMTSVLGMNNTLFISKLRRDRVVRGKQLTSDSSSLLSSAS